MACADLRPLVSALHDGELDRVEEAHVRAHLATCADCRAFGDDLARASELVTRHAPRLAFDLVSLARFEQALAREPRRRDWGGFLAAASFLAIVWGLSALVVVSGPMIVTAFTRHILPVLPYADPVSVARNAPALPHGLEGVANKEAAQALTAKQREALESSGLVQVPGDGTDLASFYGGDSALVTADAALLVYQGAVARAVLDVEREHLAPALRATLEHLLAALRSMEKAANGDLEPAARLARRVVQVAAELDGLPRRDDEAVARDVDAARRGEGRSTSAVLGREVSWSRFEPRGTLASVPEHFRALVWLGEASLRLDTDHPDELRAASLIALALARERTDLARFADLDDASSLIHGPQDDLGALDVLQALRNALGCSVRPELVGRPEALPLVAAKAAAIAASSRTGAIASVDDPAPRFRLMGAARSIEGLVISSLSGKPLPERARPTSLDLLAAMGSNAARAVASSDGTPGYSKALDGLTSILGEVTQVPRAVARSGSGVERSRLFALASLVARPDAAAPLPMATQVYSDRLLLAALAGLDAPGPAPAEGELTTAPKSPLPAIEPLPAFYARLGHGARRLALGLDTVTPRAAHATARLRRASELLSGLSLAAQETLERRELSAEARWALRSFAGAAHVLAPENVFSAETVHISLRDDGSREWLERVSGPLDRLYVVLPDEKGEPRLVSGAALSAREVVSTHPLTSGEAARAPRVDPEWASHIVR